MYQNQQGYQQYPNQGFQQPFQQNYQQPYQQNYQQMDPNTANVSMYQQLIPQYIQNKVASGVIPQHLSNTLYNTLMNEVQNGVARAAIMNHYNGRIAPQNDLLSILDVRATQYIQNMSYQYGNQYTQPQMMQQPLNNGFVQQPNPMINQQWYQQQMMQQQMMQQQRAMVQNPMMSVYSTPSPDGASLAAIYGTKPQAHNVSAFSPVPDRTVTPNPTYHQPQQVVTKQAPQPVYTQVATNASYSMDEQPSDELNEIVNKIPKSFMDVKAKKMSVAAEENGVHTEKQLDVFDVDMKFPVENIAQAKDDIEAAGIPTDKETATIASIDEIVITKGDNVSMTKSYNEVNGALNKEAKKTKDMVRLALVVMTAIRSQGEEFIETIEPKICERFNEILRIVLHFTTPQGRSYRESDVTNFEDIEVLLSKVDAPGEDFPNIEQFKLAIYAAIAGSILSVFTGKSEVLDTNDKEDKQIILNDSRLPVKIEGKPYRLFKDKTLTAEQAKELDENLKRIFAFKIRRKVIFHNNNGFNFGFSDIKDFDPKSLKTDPASKKLLKRLLDKTSQGSTYLVDITKPDQFSHPLIIAENFNKELEARRV